MADCKINRASSGLVDSRIAPPEIAGNVHLMEFSFTLTSNEDPLAGITAEFSKKEY
jgi:hypothetical protein